MAHQVSLISVQHFRLIDSTIATTSDENKDIAVVIPAGAIFTVAAPIPRDPFDEPTRRVTIVWNGHACSMFLVDVVEKSEPV